MNIDHNNQTNMQPAGASRLGRCSGFGAAAPIEDKIMKRIKESTNKEKWPREKCQSVDCRGHDLVLRITDWSKNKDEPSVLKGIRKFTGSGGAIIGICRDEAMFARLEEVMESLGARVIEPLIVDRDTA